MEEEELEKWVLGFPRWAARIRKIEPRDPFFSAGDAERELIAKQLTLDLTEDERLQLQYMENAEGEGVYCPIVGCGARLRTLNEFEDHYNARHTACCSVCSRVFPTSRLLSIHVSESHDSFFQAKVARGFPMFECLVEGCGMKLKSYQSRHQHLVDKHKFPESFQFFKKVKLSKKQRQKVHRKKSKTGAVEVMDDSGEGEQQSTQKREERERAHEIADVEMEDLVSAVSRLTTSGSAPSSICFGHRHARAFQLLPRSIQQNRKPKPSETNG
ncbi:nucleic acid binding / zinc ion binding protein [Wolffia australiana]